MKRLEFRFLLAAFLMFMAAVGADLLKPTVQMSKLRNNNLGLMVPEKFGSWKLEPTTIPVQVNPEIQARLNELYSQVLSRTYVNENGEKVMLTIAYGADQSDKHQVHRPEICYPAQGFQINGLRRNKLETIYGTIDGQRLYAKRNNDVIEEIDYWIMVGDIVAFSGFPRKIAQLKYGLNGIIPDGMLVRVSSLSNQKNGKYLNQFFINDLLRSLNSRDRERLTGFE